VIKSGVVNWNFIW